MNLFHIFLIGEIIAKISFIRHCFSNDVAVGHDDDSAISRQKITRLILSVSKKI